MVLVDHSARITGTEEGEVPNGKSRVLSKEWGIDVGRAKVPVSTWAQKMKILPKLGAQSWWFFLTGHVIHLSINSSSVVFVGAENQGI